MTRASASDSATAVVVVERVLPPKAEFLRLLDCLACDFADFEIVIVGNGLDEVTAGAVMALVDEIPDTTAHLLLDRVDHQAARLFGIDQAFGDWVLLIDLTPGQLAFVPTMLTKVRDGYDGVVVDCGHEPPLTLYEFAAGLFVRLARHTTGIPIERSSSPLRLFSRSLCLRLVNDAHGELLMSASSVSGGFHIVTFPGDYKLPLGPEPIGLRSGVIKGIGVLARSSSLPLRLVSLASFLVGVMALFYTLYVVTIYLTKEDVAPGWTTLSLQLSALMVFVSVMFWLLAEHVIVMRASMPPRRRIVVARELRSRLTRRRGLLNVVDDQGRGFRLGRGPDPTLQAHDQLPSLSK